MSLKATHTTRDPSASRTYRGGDSRRFNKAVCQEGRRSTNRYCPRAIHRKTPERQERPGASCCIHRRTCPLYVQRGSPYSSLVFSFLA
ncbi:hypothetical protein ElyMa_003064400 [Elysia marginata]|uniref:Uncharacterized protein n=1 Tax=Elysia marginata TaxID=1093978 RepID=A0AAV4IPW0_9GAST|nr:hypothetical protein ElyMa_003064400 [Elysia marginata]